MTTVSTGNLWKMNTGAPAALRLGGTAGKVSTDAPSQAGGFPAAPGTQSHHLTFALKIPPEMEPDFRVGLVVCSAAAGKQGRCQLSSHHLGGPGCFFSVLGPADNRHSRTRSAGKGEPQPHATFQLGRVRSEHGIPRPLSAVAGNRAGVINPRRLERELGEADIASGTRGLHGRHY